MSIRSQISVQMPVDADEKISKLVNMAKYKSRNQFVVKAIQKLLDEEYASIPKELPANSTMPIAEKVIEMNL